MIFNALNVVLRISQLWLTSESEQAFNTTPLPEKSKFLQTSQNNTPLQSQGDDVFLG
jgi:hypothetical protein